MAVHQFIFLERVIEGLPDHGTYCCYDCEHSEPHEKSYHIDSIALRREAVYGRKQ